MIPAPGSEVIKVRDLVVDFESHRVLNGVNVDLYRGEILGFVGASGAGKSTLARTIIGLLPKRAGRIEIFGVDIDKASHEQKRAIDRRWGVLFQQGALFSSLTVGKNIEFPVREYLRLSNRLTTEMAIAKLEMVGLEPGRLPRIPVRTVRRHDQARRARPRAGARPGNPVPRRADLRSRPDQRRRVRRAHPDAAADARAFR